MAKSPKKTKKKAKRVSQKKSLLKRLMKFFWRIFLISAVWGAIGAVIIVIVISISLPDVKEIEKEWQQPTIILLDNKGNEIDTFGRKYGQKIPFSQLPKNLVDAVTSTEDRRFFSHFGVDPVGLLRALWVNWRAGRIVQGGSTITQQLAKVAFLSHERTIKRKLQEFILALYLEATYSKEQIFEFYINRIYFGAGNYGIDSASRYYFNRPVDQLTLYECAVLAGIIRAPSRYNPAANPEQALARADQVLVNMVDNNKVSLDFLTSTEINFSIVASEKSNKSSAPYFSNWIKDQLKDYLGSFDSGTLIVETTLDSALQSYAQQQVYDTVNAAQKQYGSDTLEGAAIVMTPSGEVLAMAGGKSYQESEFNRTVQALRQPGSAFKLFVYLAALEAGFQPDDVIVDEPITISEWSPSNWNHEYIGEVTLKEALAKSINTVAVKLTKSVGMDAVEKIARKMGITSPIQPDLTSALGSSEVNLLELTGAYAHLANYGNFLWVHGISRIKTQDGIILYERQPGTETRVIPAKVAANMNEMLRYTVEEGTGKKSNIWQASAGKTGTSQENRDGWFIGYTGNTVAGIWIGQDNNSPVKGLSGGGTPALLWKKIVQKAEANKTSRALPTTEEAVLHGPSSEGDSVWQNILHLFGSSVDIKYTYPNK